MNADQIATFLLCVRSKQIHNNGEWVTAPCPFAPWKHASGKDNNPSFAIKIVSGGSSFFNCFSCNSGGSLTSLVTELMHLNQVKGGGFLSTGLVQHDLNLAQAFAILEEEKTQFVPINDWQESAALVASFKPWPESFLYHYPPASQFSESLLYMYERGFEIIDLVRFDVRYDILDHRVCFPFRHCDGKLAGMRGRSIYFDSTLPWWDYEYQGIHNTKYVYYGEDKIDWLEPVAVVEGAIKAMAVAKVYPNVISPLSTGVSVEKIKQLANCVEVLTLFDQDKAGQMAHEKFAFYLKPHKVKVTKVEYPVNSDGKDVDELSKEELRLMFNAVGIGV